MRHVVRRLRRVRMWRQNLDVQRCHARGTAVVIGLAAVAHGVSVDARVSGRELHLHEANRTETLGPESLVKIRI